MGAFVPSAIVRRDTAAPSRTADMGVKTFCLFGVIQSV